MTDPSYFDGLRLAVAAALDYGLAAIDAPGDTSDPIPIVLLAQARTAARGGVGLDIVLRRYTAGYALLREFLIDEAGDGKVGGADLKRLLCSQAAFFDRLVADVSAEHHRELESSGDSAKERQAKRVERLLGGETIDTADIPYDFDAHHIGVVVAGPLGGEAIRDVAKTLNRRPLIVFNEAGGLWAWLGGREGLDSRDLYELISDKDWSARVALAIGEPSLGLSGWRITHQQARAALPIARLGAQTIGRYADVAILSSAARDDLLVNSLHQMFLAPLEAESDGGRVFRETLRAFFASGHQVSSAAAVLDVKRHTVTRRLRAIEEALGQPLSVCAAELDTALRLEEVLGRSGMTTLAT